MGDGMTLRPAAMAGDAGIRRLEDIRRRVASAAKDDGALRRAAVELESLFIHQLLKEMRNTVPRSGLVEDGAGRDIHTTLIDMQLSRQLAREGGIGLADLIFDSLKAVGEYKYHSDAKKLTLPAKALSDIDR